MKIKRVLLFIVFLLLSSEAIAKNKNIVNVYIWANDIPDTIIQQFEEESGIKVNLSTYDSNETLYAKLKTSDKLGYDIIMPSSYYVERMAREGMLEKLDKSKLSRLNNLDPEFTHQAYDPKFQYSIPYMWGATGIFVNDKYIDPKSIQSWSDLWNKKYDNQLLVLDDARELFSIGLIDLGYSPNSKDKVKIKSAYNKLKSLRKNIKVFATDSAQSIMVDEDAIMGIAWNGDVYRVSLENPHVKFILPSNQPFALWTDSFAIPKNAPHLDNAHKFLNFMLKPKVAAACSLDNGYPTPNQAAKAYLPKAMVESKVVYPDKQTMDRGISQTDVGDEALSLYDYYWERFKIGA